MLIKDLKELKKTDTCPICGNSSFKNLGKITNEKKKTCKIGGYDDLINYLDYIENIKSNKLNKEFILYLINNKK